MGDKLERLWSEGRRADTLLGCGLLGFSGVLVYEANQLPPPFFDPLGSAAAPRFVAGLLALLAIIIMGRCLITPLKIPVPVPDALETGAITARPSPLAAVGVVLVPVLYLLLMQFRVLGFAPASALVVIVLATILGQGQRRVVLASIPIALGGAYGLNALLTRFFYIDLPQHSFWMGGL